MNNINIEITDKDKEKQRRAVVYLSESDYLELRSHLILAGQSVSQWMRDQIKRYLADSKK